MPPAYPAEAIAARITGTVTIEAVIDPAGNVTSARVLQGVPMLDDAALAAVRQWKYTPTLVNGEPVAVIMTVDQQVFAEMNAPGTSVECARAVGATVDLQVTATCVALSLRR